MSFGSKGKFAIASQPVLDSAPGTGYVYYPFSSDGLANESDDVQSPNIRPNRTPGTSVRTRQGARGPVNFGFSIATWDPILEAVMFNNWTSSIAFSGTLGATAVTNVFSGTGAFTNVVAPQWIKVGGFTNPVNNGWHWVTTKTDNNTVTVASALGTEAGTGDETVESDGKLLIGEVDKYLAIEKKFPGRGGGSDYYMLFLNMLAGGISLTIQPGQPVTGNIPFQGKMGIMSTSSDAGTPTDTSQADVLSAITDVLFCRLGANLSADTAFDLSQVSFTLDNRIFDALAIKKLDPIATAPGIAQVTGTVGIYVDDGIEVETEAHRNNTRRAFSVGFEDQDGNAFIVTMPQIKYTASPVTIEGAETVVRATMNFSAETMEHVDGDVALQFDRLNA